MVICVTGARSGYGSSRSGRQYGIVTSPEGKRADTTADQVTLCNKETHSSSQPHYLRFLPRRVLFYRLDYLCYRNTFTMADSDLAPNFAPFFSFVSDLVSLKLRTVQLTNIPD